MKKLSNLGILIAVCFICITSISSCKSSIDAISGSTLVWQSGSNNFFNQTEPKTLEGNSHILITGEVESDETIDLTDLPLRSVTIMEAKVEGSRFHGDFIDSTGWVKKRYNRDNPAQIAPNGAPASTINGRDFYGAFRYDGYALCDILNSIKIDKVNKNSFYPPVDLYVEISNDKGDKALFSWGEIFYAACPYSIIIAKRATRLPTGKTGELWPYPTQTKIVCKNDLIAERNIPNPSKITIRSLKGNYIVVRNDTIFKHYPGYIKVVDNDYQELGKIGDIDKSIPVVSHAAIFYGRSMGFKGEKTFTGPMLRDILIKYFNKYDPKFVREGMFSICGIDGYRCAFSVSEVLNRNDQREILLINEFKKLNRNNYRAYIAPDHFADRAIRSVSEIRLIPYDIPED
ncbi:MAG: hypothetical protein WC140_04145 [Bacteroidales bacterium]